MNKKKRVNLLLLVIYKEKLLFSSRKGLLNELRLLFIFQDILEGEA
jgi:hypothetical protein